MLSHAVVEISLFELLYGNKTRLGLALIVFGDFNLLTVLEHFLKGSYGFRQML